MKLTNEQLIEIGIALGGAFLIGWILKQFLFPLLARFTKRTRWKSDEIIVEQVRGWVIFWFMLGAIMYILPILSDVYPAIDKRVILITRIIGTLYIFSVTWVIAHIIAGLLEIRSKQDNTILPSTSILGNIVKAMIYVIGFILILQTFGVAIAPLVTALGVGGIAVALALQPTLSNLFSGLQIIASGKMNIGDFVQIENGKRGIIHDITWRNTVLKTAENNLIILPNSKMSDSIVENFFLSDKEITFNVTLGVSYDSDLEHVEKVSIDVAKEVLNNHQMGINEFEPFVRFFNFGDSSIQLSIFLRVKEYADQFLIISDFIKALHQRYNKEKIEIPFPIRTLLMKDIKENISEDQNADKNI